LAVRASAEGATGTGERFTVTTPLYYVNAAPHMGSAYPTIAADALARFHRLAGRKVMFVTGTDEHGEKIALAAEKQGKTPKQHCDDVVSGYKALWEMLDIKYDSFIRTTDPHHERLVAEVLQRVKNRGDIYKAKYEGYYCVDCEEYKDESEMDASNNCPVHRRPCQHRSEENYFFALSKYQKQLEQLIEGTDFVQPPSRRNEVLGWVREGVRDFSISRANVQWGIPLPWDPSQTVYVWFDALNGYLSALFAGAESEASADQALTRGWPANTHVIGKDILRFHAVYWPGMLMSAGMPLPGSVYGHGFLTKDGMKMGKSLGNVLDPVALTQAYGPDAVRYYFLRSVDFGTDGDFSEDRFRDQVNAVLANDVGNLLNRSLSLLKKSAGGAFPISAMEVGEEAPLRAMAEDVREKAASDYASLRFMRALEAISSLSSRGNLRMQETEPWVGVKSEDPAVVAKAHAVLVECVEAIRIVAVLLSPVTPSLSRRIYAQLGYAPEAFETLTWEDAKWGGLRAGTQFPKPSPVFLRMEGDMVTEPAVSASKSKVAAAQ